MVTVEESVGRGVREEGGKTGRARRIFQNSETILHDAVMIATCPCVFVQTHRMYITKSES